MVGGSSCSGSSSQRPEWHLNKTRGSCLQRGYLLVCYAFFLKFSNMATEREEKKTKQNIKRPSVGSSSKLLFFPLSDVSYLCYTINFLPRHSITFTQSSHLYTFPSLQAFCILPPIGTTSIKSDAINLFSSPFFFISFVPAFLFEWSYAAYPVILARYIYILLPLESIKRSLYRVYTEEALSDTIRSYSRSSETAL